jgi:hypothetical protein
MFLVDLMRIVKRLVRIVAGLVEIEASLVGIEASSVRNYPSLLRILVNFAIFVANFTLTEFLNTSSQNLAQKHSNFASQTSQKLNFPLKSTRNFNVVIPKLKFPTFFYTFWHSFHIKRKPICTEVFFFFSARPCFALFWRAIRQPFSLFFAFKRLVTLLV